MATGGTGRGVGVLLRELVDGSVALLRGELHLATLEMRAAARGLGIGTALIATGAVCGLLGALCLLVGLVLLAGDQWLADGYWLAALFALALACAVAAALAARGLALLSPRRLAVRETMTTLKGDTAWLKQRLTSGATSS